MALDQSALLDLLAQLKLTDVSGRIRSVTEVLYPELIDAEVASVIGAGKYERTEMRTTQRNGTRPRTLTTTAGDLDLRIPKLRRGSFFPSLLGRSYDRFEGGFLVLYAFSRCLNENLSPVKYGVSYVGIAWLSV